ncbi:hypothetical protein C0J52_04204 [Blattella germanica]|nr:hypothetical protein C0J52_04204 [Blattella germanica]
MLLNIWVCCRSDSLSLQTKGVLRSKPPRRCASPLKATLEMPVDISTLTEGWLELESDPGLFTLLLEDFGVKGVQVEEIYDLQKSLEGPIYGFIFLFRWIEERRSRRKTVDQSESFVKDEDVVNSIFFAQQMVPNSCATHALLSVLLNCPTIHLGATLSRLKAHTTGMCPENKGWAIGNTPELAKAHNSHAMPQAKRRLNDSSAISTGRYTGEAYHFVSYVPIRGRLFELDGLKPFPIDHGPWGEKEDWTEKFHCVIADRLGIATGEHDICFNLMAVVPDKILALTHKLKMLKTNRQIVLEALQQLVKLTHPDDKEKNTEHKKVAPISPTKTVLDHAQIAVTPSTTAENSMQQFEASCAGATSYSTPLTIQTSPAPSSSSTDTSSEMGSSFNSPTQEWDCNSGKSSPISCKDFKKLVAIHMTRGGAADEEKTESSSCRSIAGLIANTKRKCGDHVDTMKKTCFENAKASEKSQEQINVQLPIDANPKKVDMKLCSDLFEPHTFAPKDLLALLKNLEKEIGICEVNLRDENEKRRKYKIDDCRRTHNYDDFICTFLSMLAQQGKLADLVQQHFVQQGKPALPIPRVPSRPAKKPEQKPNPSHRRRGRSKYRKRK